MPKRDRREEQRQREAVRRKEAEKAFDEFPGLMAETIKKIRELKRETYVEEKEKELLLGNAEVDGNFVILKAGKRKERVNFHELTLQLRTLINKLTQLRDNRRKLLNGASALKENHWNYLDSDERQVMDDMTRDSPRIIENYDKEIHDYSIALARIMQGEHGN